MILPAGDGAAATRHDCWRLLLYDDSLGPCSRGLANVPSPLPAPASPALSDSPTPSALRQMLSWASSTACTLTDLEQLHLGEEGGVALVVGMPRALARAGARHRRARS